MNEYHQSSSSLSFRQPLQECQCHSERSAKLLGDLGVSPALSLPGFVALGKSLDLRAPVSLFVNQHVTSTHH